MLTKISLGKHSLTGVSLGGVYTSLCVPELNSIFDIGIAPRSFVGPNHLFLSHAHADHIGALPSLIGVRGLARQPAPTIYAPIEIVDDIRMGLEAFSRGQRTKLPIEILPCEPGTEYLLFGDLSARAFRTIHSVPSLGYQLFRRVSKLRSEFLELGALEIGERRRNGEDMFDQVERLEFAYATDTLVDVLDAEPSLYNSKTLVLECTFLDERKSTRDAREKSHVHLNEIIERAELFQNEHLVLMHFSQLYQPREVHQILKSRLPECLQSRVRAFAPQNGPWPG
jgi:ribonuclease Z